MAKRSRLSAETDEALLEIYTQAAAEHGRASLAADYNSGNRASGVMEKVYSELKRRERASSLTTLLSNAEPSVVVWAATHLLPFSPQRAEKSLKRLSRSDTGPIAFSAKVVLEQWHSGDLY